MNKARIALATGIVLLTASAAWGAIVAPLNLEQLTGSAGRIFAGVCTGAEQDVDAATGTRIYRYRFKPSRMLKGPGGDPVTVTLHHSAVRYGRLRGFAVGEEVVLFLYPESEVGFTSPVGIGQGAFSVLTGADGTRVVVNERNNAGLFANMTVPALSARMRGAALSDDAVRALSAPSGPVAYRVFLNLVEALLGQYNQPQTR